MIKYILQLFPDISSPTMSTDAAMDAEEKDPTAITGDTAEIEKVRGVANTGTLHKIVLSVKEKLGSAIGAAALLYHSAHQ